MRSIRSRLIVLLFGALFVIYGLVAARVFQETTHEIEEVFDAELNHFVAIIMNLTRHELQEQSESGLTTGVTAHLFGGVDRDTGSYRERDDDDDDDDDDDEDVADGDAAEHPYRMKIVFQIWQAGGGLIYRSVGAPTQPLATLASGYSDSLSGERRWRVFSLTDRDLGITVHAGEERAVRDELIGQISSKVFGPLVVGLPVLALMVWILVGRGLAPVHRLAASIGQRDPTHLEPIAEQQTPSELRPLIHALNHLLGRLQRAMENQRRFTADAAHEIRTPLAGLKLQAQVALGASDDRERTDALQAISQAVDRTMRMVEQLLMLARYDARLPDGNALPTDLNTLAAEELAELSAMADRRRIELALERDPAARVAGSAEMLRILMRNLIENAILYNRPSGSVAVRLIRRAGEVELSVLDTGPGIDDASKLEVFRPFYRMAHVGVGGSGLGLSIVARIVELHGGRIRIEDGDGGGSRFVVTLRAATNSG